MQDDILSAEWDVIVIGAGLGGGICGRALAEAGMRVLFLDRGPAGLRRAENGLGCPHRERFARSLYGLWPEPLRLDLDGRALEEDFVQGIGMGGTSVHYAASLERPERHDLESVDGLPHPTGGWPVGYDGFRSWFERAQALMELSGTPDPLRPDPVGPLAAPPPLSPGEAAMVRAMEAAGLHPYRTHLAIRGVPGCEECIGRKCPRDCKRDGRSAGVEPALATGRAAFLGSVTVRALRCRDGRVTHLELERGGERIRLGAPSIVLAAGGLGSAQLLLASADEAAPQGCANGSGLVGRGLMFHLSERVAIWPPQRSEAMGPWKTLSLRDFYVRDGQRLGLVQSIGLPADYGNVVHALNQIYDRSPLRRLRRGRGLLRLPAYVASRILGQARIFVGIIEDLPVDANRVTHDPQRPDAFHVTYRTTPELTRRRALMRRELGRGLRGLRHMMLSQGVELNLAHPCGTLRFSDDPRRGVLDRDCRAHGLANLHVADSSFMPTSTGVNPSLTIVANALRVADALLRDRRAGAAAA